jgi:hypothetical protein
MACIAEMKVSDFPDDVLKGMLSHFKKVLHHKFPCPFKINLGSKK